MQEPRRRVTGAAGAPGLVADQALRKGGESATTPHPRMKAPRVQGGQCRPRLAEDLWAQAGTHAMDATTCNPTGQ